MEDFKVECPCCGESLVVNPRAQTISGDKTGPDKASDLSEALRKAGKPGKDSADAFAKALAAERKRQTDLEDAFQKAREKAKDKPTDQAPDRPMDDRWR